MKMLKNKKRRKENTYREINVYGEKSKEGRKERGEEGRR